MRNVAYVCKLVDVYFPATDGIQDTCMRTANTTIPDPNCSSLLSVYKYVFIFGQLLHGIGATPLYTLGVSYLDDNLLSSTTSLYVGKSS